MRSSARPALKSVSKNPSAANEDPYLLAPELGEDDGVVAVVFMTDGADNTLFGFGGRGSRVSFADLLETVRRDDTLVVPVYLDTEGRDPVSHAVYDYARKTLAMLAEESGGLYYKTRKLEEPEAVYRQVVEDLGKVYSLGYRPTNAKRNGSWRTVKIEIPNRAGLVPRVRRGYYAK